MGVLRRNEKLKSCGVTDGCNDSSHEQDERRRKAQGQSGEDTSHETGASEKRGSGDSRQREGGGDPDVGRQ